MQVPLGVADEQRMAPTALKAGPREWGGWGWATCPCRDEVAGLVTVVAGSTERPSKEF